MCIVYVYGVCMRYIKCVCGGGCICVVCVYMCGLIYA